MRYAPDRIKAREGVESVPQRLKPVVFVSPMARLKVVPFPVCASGLYKLGGALGQPRRPTLAARPYAAAMWSPDDLCIQPESACRNTGVPNIATEKNRSLSTVPRKNGSPAA